MSPRDSHQAYLWNESYIYVKEALSSESTSPQKATFTITVDIGIISYATSSVHTMNPTSGLIVNHEQSRQLSAIETALESQGKDVDQKSVEKMNSN